MHTFHMFSGYMNVILLMAFSAFSLLARVHSSTKPGALFVPSLLLEASYMSACQWSLQC